MLYYLIEMDITFGKIFSTYVPGFKVMSLQVPVKGRGIGCV